MRKIINELKKALKERRRKKTVKWMQREKRRRAKEDLKLQKRIARYDNYELPPDYTEEEKERTIMLLKRLEVAKVKSMRRDRKVRKRLGPVLYVLKEMKNILDSF